MPVTRYTTVKGQIIAEKRGGTRSFYAADPLGSVAEVYDNSGTETAAYFYWPYGEVRDSSGTDLTPFTFCGTWGYYTDSSARTYVRARHYRPGLTRWQTVDPLWPSKPSYEYAATLPQIFLDRNGLMTLSVLAAYLEESAPIILRPAPRNFRDYNEFAGDTSGYAAFAWIWSDWFCVRSAVDRKTFKKTLIELEGGHVKLWGHGGAGRAYLHGDGGRNSYIDARDLRDVARERARLGKPKFTGLEFDMCNVMQDPMFVNASLELSEEVFGYRDWTLNPDTLRLGHKRRYLNPVPPGQSLGGNDPKPKGRDKTSDKGRG